MIRPAALALLLAAPVAAQAQDQPPAQRPTRDVSVTYAMEAPGYNAAQELRMSWLAAEDRVRVEPAGAPGWILLDRRSGEAFMVMDSARVARRLPPEMAARTSEIPPGSRFTRGATATVAGQRCTEWRVVMPSGGEADTCLTADGVMLRTVTRAGGGRGAKIEARQVAYGTQPAAAFRVPEGYAVTAIPEPGRPPQGQPPPSPQPGDTPAPAR